MPTISEILNIEAEQYPDLVKSIRSYFDDKNHQAMLIQASGLVSSKDGFGGLVALGVPPSIIGALNTVTEAYFIVHKDVREKPEEKEDHGFHMPHGDEEEKPEEVLGNAMKDHEKYKEIKKELDDDKKYQDALKRHGKKLDEELKDDEEFKQLTDEQKKDALKEKLAEKEFRSKYKDEAKKCDLAEAKSVYLQSENDPLFKKYQKEIEQEYQKRLQKNPKADKNQLRKEITEKAWNRFTEKYEDKAVAYEADNNGLSKAIDRREEKLKNSHKESIEQDLSYKRALIQARNIAQKDIQKLIVDGHDPRSEEMAKIRLEARAAQIRYLAMRYPEKAAYYFFHEKDTRLRILLQQGIQAWQKKQEFVKEKRSTQIYDEQQRKLGKQFSDWKKQEQERLNEIKKQIHRKYITVRQGKQDDEENGGSQGSFDQQPPEQPRQPEPTRPNVPRNLPPRRPPSPQQLAQQAQNALRAARGILQVARLAPLLANPIFWIVIGVILLIILNVVIIFLIIQGVQNAQKERAEATGIPGLTLEKQAPPRVQNGQTIIYTIAATYRGNQDVTITDPLPEQTEFVEATGNYTISNQSGKTTLQWRLMDNQQGPIGIIPSQDTLDTSFPTKKFNDYGFPNPTTPLEMSPAEEERWKTYVMPSAIKAGQLTGVDPGIIGMWAWLETKFDTFASNCNDSVRYNPNYYCPSGLWQVGNGIQFYEQQANLVEAFRNMYPGQSVQSVGQKVIDASRTRTLQGGPITQPSTQFPDVSIETLAQAKDQTNRMYAAILMKDDAIGAYLIAKSFENRIGPRLASTMQGWQASYYNPQKIVNYIAGIYKVGLSQIAPTPLSETGAGPLKVFNFTLTIKPLAEDIVVSNTLIATIAGSSLSGAIGSLMPNPLPPETEGVQNAKKEVQALLAQHPENVEVYKQAEIETGIPWQVLAGKHYIEGGMGPNKSLVSGRVIGTDEPDVRRSGGGCSSGEIGPGKAVPVAGGCGFKTLLDSAIYAGNHLKGKLGGQAPANYQDLVTALSRYNGGGNSNCGKGVPYIHCPPDFEGDDDPYPMNFFDFNHNVMYLIYCADLTKCNPPKQFQRPGVMTIIRALL